MLWRGWRRLLRLQGRLWLCCRRDSFLPFCHWSRLYGRLSMALRPRVMSFARKQDHLILAQEEEGNPYLKDPQDRTCEGGSTKADALVGLCHL